MLDSPRERQKGPAASLICNFDRFSQQGSREGWENHRLWPHFQSVLWLNREIDDILKIIQTRIRILETERYFFVCFHDTKYLLIWILSLNLGRSIHLFSWESKYRYDSRYKFRWYVSTHSIEQQSGAAAFGLLLFASFSYTEHELRPQTTRRKVKAFQS